MKKSSLFLWFFVVALLAGAAVAALWAIRPTIAVTEAKRGRAINAMPATVAVRADHLTELRSEGGGRVKTSVLELGRRVKEGEVLVQIDDADLRIELERITRDYETARKRLEVGSGTALNLANARENLATLTRQTEAGGYPPAELEKRKREVQQIEQTLALEQVNNEAQLAGLKSEIKRQERLIEKARIVSPDDGDVITVVARPGDLIGSGASLGTILSSARVVEAKISEENFSGVALGQKAIIRLLGYGAEQFNATVSKILPDSDPLTQRYTVHLKVDIAPERLVPGLSGEASIIVGERAEALIIPRRALLGDYVLLVKAGRVEQRRVKKGYESLNEVEIASGIEVGDQVITDNLDSYRQGDRVRIRQP